jgi:hypothetical protein
MTSCITLGNLNFVLKNQCIISTTESNKIKSEKAIVNLL